MISPHHYPSSLWVCRRTCKLAFSYGLLMSSCDSAHKLVVRDLRHPLRFMSSCIVPRNVPPTQRIQLVCGEAFYVEGCAAQTVQ